mmetsp:Transcript_69337/g.151399  ORF Transcript_69337/g.151399 Transcript_69337/m.151399 type:complete len:1049 (+) Transcript_69337:114-3260(+)
MDPREVSPEEFRAPSHWARDVRRATAATARMQSASTAEAQGGQPPCQSSCAQPQGSPCSRTGTSRKGASLWSQAQVATSSPSSTDSNKKEQGESASECPIVGQIEGGTAELDDVNVARQDEQHKQPIAEQEGGGGGGGGGGQADSRQGEHDQTNPSTTMEEEANKGCPPASLAEDSGARPSKKFRIRTGSLEAPSSLARVGTIFQVYQLEEQVEGVLPKEALCSLEAAVFEDTRWKNALRHLFKSGEWRNRQALEGLIRAGAKTFGFWHLPSPIVEALAAHLDVKLHESVGSAPTESEALPPSDALMEQLEEVKSTIAAHASTSTAAAAAAAGAAASSGRAAAAASTAPNLAFKSEYIPQQQGGRLCKCFAKLTRQEAWAAKLWLTSFVLVLSNIYAMEVCCIMYPGLVNLFGIPIWIARAGGMGTLLWTALLFLTMSRTVIRIVARLLPLQSAFYEVLDQHKELHIFCGQMCFLTGAVHTIAHCVGTVPGIISRTLDEINAILGCANPDSTPGYIGTTFAALQLTECPLKERPTYLGAVVTTTPGLSGVALVVLAVMLFYTASAKARQLKFERFIYLHYIAIPLWLAVLFLHGSAGWVGVGFPLVTFVCSLPCALYLLDHILRGLRYYLVRGSLQVEDVVIRPGMGGQGEGSLINLKIRKPSILWSYREGMYAFLCMPHYSKWQWHPFTICSGADEPTVDFIIHACGDWTKELASICLEAHSRRGLWMQLAMDGPYLAPTATALSHEVLVAVGAGVGITPFLSLMSTIISIIGKGAGGALPLKEAHFFWMTRSADELLFGRRQFTRIVTDPTLRGKVYLHLHITQKDIHADAASYLFREIVRRQSVIDRSAFLQAWKSLPEFAEVSRGLQFPSCWSVGVDQDVLWTSSLVESVGLEEGRVDNELAEAYTDHWASGIRALRANSTNSAETRKSQTRGLFAPTRSTSMAADSSIDSSALTPRESVSIPIERARGVITSLPIIFGRPNFQKELRAIGKANPNQNVHVYACGNDALVQSLKSCCSHCSLSAKASKQGPNTQDFVLHYERFG